jgi:hypothetical protein
VAIFIDRGAPLWNTYYCRQTPPFVRRERLRGISRPNAPRNLGSALTLDYGNVVLALQIKPELCTVSEIATEPNRGVGGDGPATVQYVGYAARRYSKVECEPICAELARL